MLGLQPISLLDLLLSRLLFCDQAGMTTSTLKQTLKTIAGSELSNSAFTTEVAYSLDALHKQGHIESVSHSRYKVTETGQRLILNKVGLDKLPPKLQWNTFKNADLIAYALHLPALTAETRKHLASADGLRAAILKYHFKLPVDNFASVTDTRNVLLWQQLCDPHTATNLQAQQTILQKQSFTQGAVMGALFHHLLQSARPLPWQKALPQLIAKIANAKQTAPDQLRLALLRQALVREVALPAATEVDVPPSSPLYQNGAVAESKQTALSDAEFAKMTHAAATATKDGRLGEYKVFISRVWQTLQQQRPELSLPLDQFKERLIAANQQRLLTLSRADMAYALDPDDVAASEIQHMNSTFHFIRLD